MRATLSGKQSQILLALSEMLGRPHAERISTAALAAHLGQSEAALYRHFPNKSAMFDALLRQISEALNDDLDHIRATTPHGRAQVRRQVHALLLFAERHPGLTRVLTGEALVTEDAHLSRVLSDLIDVLQNALCKSVRDAIEQGALPADVDANIYAAVLLDWAAGRWLRFSQSAWRTRPTSDHSAHLDHLGLAL